MSAGSEQMHLASVSSQPEPWIAARRAGSAQEGRSESCWAFVPVLGMTAKARANAKTCGAEECILSVLLCDSASSRSVKSRLEQRSFDRQTAFTKETGNNILTSLQRVLPDLLYLRSVEVCHIRPFQPTTED